MYQNPAAIDRASESLHKPLIKIYKKNHVGYETHEVIAVISRYRRYKLSPDRTCHMLTGGVFHIQTMSA